MDFNNINTIAWVMGNVLVAYTAIAITVFVLGYYILFDPRSTTAGRLLFRFMLSLVGVISLIFVGTFVNPPVDRGWTVLADDVLSWRPITRLLVYSYVAFTITSLAILLGIRKWKPSYVKTAADRNLVEPRNNTNAISIKHK